MTDDNRSIVDALLRSAPLGISAYNFQGDCIMANEAIASTIGASLEQVLTQNFRKIESWKKSGLLANAENAITTGRSSQQEHLVTTTFGKKAWFSAHTSRFMLDNEAHLLLILEDINERRQAEEFTKTQRDLGLKLSATHDLEETLRICVDAAIEVSEMDCGGMYLTNDSSGIDLAYNAGLPEAFLNTASHYEADSPNTKLVMLGVPIYTMHGDMSVPFDEVRRSEKLRAIAIVPIVHEERVIACLNIASHTIDEIPDYARTALETIASQIGSFVAHSITDRKLKASEKQNRLLVENMGDMVSLHRADSTIIYVSPSCEKLLGFKQEELINTQSTAVVHSEDIDDTWAIINGAVSKQDEHYVLQHRLRHKDGRYIWMETVGQLSYGPDGSLLEIQCSLRDISGRKRAEEEKLELERQVLKTQKMESLGMLAGGVAHDFNNLLMGVLGNAELALMRMTPESPGRDNIFDIQTAAERAADLASQMLAYSGKGHFVITVVELKSLIEEIVHLLEVSISKKVIVRYDFSAMVPPIEADATQIRQVIMNTVINASESIADRNGVISIRTGAIECDRAYLDETFLDNHVPEGVYSYFEVVDTGSGMDEETIVRIFDPFYSTKFTGRGLGLAAVLGIVRGHKGAIKVHSEIGRGTTFRILFPAKKGLTISPGEQSSSKVDTKLKGRTLLLVDDEETVRVVGKEMLKSLGLEVVTAEDGREALALLKEAPDKYDFILLDLTMPHMNGEEAFLEMRRVRKDICAILTSGYSEQDLITRFAGKGFAGFIQKPYRMAKLKEILLGAKTDQAK